MIAVAKNEHKNGTIIFKGGTGIHQNDSRADLMREEIV